MLKIDILVSEVLSFCAMLSTKLEKERVIFFGVEIDHIGNYVGLQVPEEIICTPEYEK